MPQLQETRHIKNQGKGASSLAGDEEVSNMGDDGIFYEE
jgi:hypothetical protein